MSPRILPSTKNKKADPYRMVYHQTANGETKKVFIKSFIKSFFPFVNLSIISWVHWFWDGENYGLTNGKL